MKGLGSKLYTIFLVALFVISVQINVCAEEGWKRQLSLGYNQSNGNTDKSELNISGEIKNIMIEAEFLGKLDLYYSSSNKKMDSQKWIGLTRYFYDFGEAKQWFNSYQIQVDHDRFADIDYRILPSTGIGYWISKEADWKAMVEASLGYEITNYKSTKPDDEDVVLIGHAYMEKKILDNARISEDISIIPSLEGNGIRMRSETVFTNPLSEVLDLSIKFVVEHDTKPSADFKKTDTFLITGLKYSF
ncbi:MAG: DUF481 domain-containing protein [Candidatus Omnitrophica bacterium]|nr:DUF481 domain-containing protein [Candidatus Omnitrophota bacterium]